MLLSNIIRNITTWEQLKSALNVCDNKVKGDVFEQITKYYLLWKPEFASKLKNVWLTSEVPIKIQKKLNLPSNDQGIDLITETVEGEFWSIQCKYISDESASISHRKISTFMSLSFGIATGIKFGLVCTTVDDYAHLYRGKKNIGFVLSDEWSKLGASFFDFVRANVSNKKIIFKPTLKPRDHQKRALENAVKYFVKEKNNRGKLVFPCGAGKSLTGYWILQRLKSKSLIVAVPSLALVKQTLEVYLEQVVANDENVRWLCVCSDEGIGKNDDVAVHTQDIGIPCVTDTNTISHWLTANKGHKTIVFTTYQSGKAIADAARKSKHIFDLGIMDEAHKTVGAKDKYFSHLLFDKNISIRKRIFMTATERRYQGTSDEVLSMDDVDMYGETFEDMSFKEAVESGILSDYKIITTFVSDDDIHELLKDNVLVKSIGSRDSVESESRALVSLVALRKAMQKYPIKHAVSFHSSIAKASDFKQSQDVFSAKYREFAPIETFHVSGAMPTAIRSRIVNEFAACEKGLITNAKCLTEGVDVPGIDAILFADPRKSTIDIVQAVGRALRKKEGKEFGYVILPISIGSQTNEEFAESDGFKDILQTLRALASNDERIIEYFRDVSNGKRPASGRLIEFDIDEKLASLIDEKKLIDTLELTAWSRLAKLSWQPFQEAREFVRGLAFENEDQWRAYCKSGEKPLDIPTNPHRTYRTDGWVGMGDWLGTGTIAARFRIYRPFEEAREFVRGLGLKDNNAWRKYATSDQKPVDIPYNPDRLYDNDGWVSYGDWLGTGRIANTARIHRAFRDARNYVHSLKLKNKEAWQNFCKSPQRPADIPANPDRVYAEHGWKGFGDWLGTGNIANHQKKFRSFRLARTFARQLNLKNFSAWNTYCKSGRKPNDIPSNPNLSYAGEGWKSWGDWLGTGAVHSKNFLTFEEARKYSRALNLHGENEWRNYCKSGKRPDFIPSNPNRTYAHKGWIDWKDWLGNEK